MTGLIEKIKEILLNYEEERMKMHISGYSKAEQALCAIKQEIEQLCPHGDYFFHCKESGEEFDEPCTLAHMQDSEICCEHGDDEND